MKRRFGKRSKFQFHLIVTLLVVLASILMFTFSIAYVSAKNEVLDVGGEMFTKVLKDVIGFMHIMDERVKAGEITLEEAQEIVRTYVNGEKKPNGYRDINTSKMSVDDCMYLWATSFHKAKGVLTMHPFWEGKNVWNYQVQGRYTIQETWGNIKKTGYVFRELWQNPGEPVYTIIAYQEYFSPWDWIVGCGGRQEIIYERRLEGLKRKFLLIGGVFFLIAIIFTYSFRQAETDRLRAEKALHKANDELEKRVRERTAELSTANSKLHQEIIERKKTEDALRKSERRFRDISYSTADYIWEVDKNVRFTYVSGKVKQILGYDPEEMIGKTPLDLMPKEDAERVEEIFKKIFSEKKRIINFENWYFTKKGNQVCLQANGVPILDGKGEILGYRGVDKDITAKKQAEKKLKQTLKELERSNTELEQFAYVASHDLQEPLRKIQAFGDRLKTKCGNDLNDRGRDYLKRMQNAAKRMQTLINDLLTFSRVSTKTQPFTQVDLSNVVQKTLSNLETFIEQTVGCVEVGNLPTIDADPTQMHQLLQNLISNALKFHRKEEAPFVKIYGQLIKRQEKQPAGVLPAYEYCQIVVEDNGIGFDEKYLDRIFGVFQRLHGRGVYEGTGIGLANCRKIVERHGGNITAKSTPGKGATFIVTLPVKQTQKGNAHNESTRKNDHNPLC